MINGLLKWVIIFVVFLLAFLGGYLIYKSFKAKPPVWQPSQQVSPPQVQNSTPTPAISGTSSPNVSTLPRTGVPIGLMIIFASSAAMAGFYLRKFPE